MTATTGPENAMKAQITPSYAFKALAITAVFNTIIAIFLTIVRFKGGVFLTNFIFSQCIGLSICACMLGVHHLFDASRPILQLVLHLTGMILGSVVGIVLGGLLSGIGIMYFVKESIFFLQLIFFGLLFGSVASYFFLSRERLATSETLAQQERIRRLVSDKKMIETNLRLLQAQIEPHFLFNTLSNILSLLDTDTHKARTMLEDLIRYLRTSLSRSREKITTIGQELDQIQAYMNIYKIRMGRRLTFCIDVSQTARGLPFPPMMIQPLVENAIKHGLEPKINGGEIRIAVQAENNLIRVVVADTGLGMTVAAPPGTGIANIRERLHSLFNGNAQLILEENTPSGLRATLEVPHVAT